MSNVLYPSSVSRTISTSKHSIRTVVALHDKQLSDADYNLTQDTQDAKREHVLENSVCSGSLSYKPFEITTNISNAFNIPAFDVMVQNQVLKITGNLSSDPTQNSVVVPAPGYWTPGSSNAEIGLYVVFLEVWNARLDPASGIGFYTDPVTGLRYIYPYGCVNADPSNLIPDDTIDVFNKKETTERVQLQWALRVQPIATSYDFTKYRFGLDPGAITAETVFGQGPQSVPQQGSPYQFTNLASISGDPGLWRSGDGNVNNDLATLDGYTYALPIAVVMQRNTGAYSIASNPFGAASSSVPSSGLLSSGISGRYDGKFADVVYASDIVDTRSTVSLVGYDAGKLTREGFVDLISGNTRLALARGVTPGGNVQAIGSTLDYQIALSATVVPNADTVGQFDGFMNGFRVDGTTFQTTKTVTVNNKIVGVVGGRWTQGDVVSYSVPGNGNIVIDSVQIQTLVNNPATASLAPVSLLEGQISITGIGSNTITVTFSKNLIGTSFDPGTNQLYLTLGVTYPPNYGIDLRHIPSNVYGGQLTDAESGKTLPVFGVDYYAVQASQPVTTALAVWAVNPQYSNVIFGTRVWIPLLGSSGSQSTDTSGNITTSFTIPRANLNGNLTGIYVTRAWDSVTGEFYSITSRSIQGENMVLGIQGAVVNTSTVIVSFICSDTVQLAFNPAVKGVTAIEEVVFSGTVNDDINFHMDDRISVVSVSNLPGISNTVVLASSNSILNGIAGDDIVKFVWVQDTSGNYNAVQIGSVLLSNGMATIIVPPTVNLTVQPFFFVTSILPTLTSASTLLLAESYVPYQGEGILEHDYEVVFSEDHALVTTNGTGAAPNPGLSDVYPYNREIPISTQLPSRAGWLDNTLENAAYASIADSNYVAKRFDNVEHTFEVPVHSNDFIQPIGMDRRKVIQFSASAANRGFSAATPHVGFAIAPLMTRSSNTAALSTTTAPITLYVDNVLGNDGNSGITLSTAFKTIQAAVDSLPPVLRHNCLILVNPSSTPISIVTEQNDMTAIPLGDGSVVQSNYYALANLAFTVQEAGCLTISGLSPTNNPVIDCTGFQGFGDGPTSAFFINNTRVILRNLTFQGFTDAAIKGIGADVELVNCTFQDNLLSGSFEEGSSIVLSNCSITLGSGATGIIVSQSAMDISSTSIGVISGVTPNAFWVVERSSTLSLDLHTPTQETNILGPMQIVEALLNSSVVCSNAYSSGGSATLSTNSVLSRTVLVSPFLGGVATDAYSNVSTDL